MKVFLGNRQSGKTQALIDWIMEGEPTLQYPNWSRVIVCPNHEQTVLVYKRLRKATEGVDSQEHPYVHDLRKAVWSINDLRANLRGSLSSHRGEFEIALDNADLIIREALGWGSPSLITITGELYDTKVEGAPAIGS